MPWLPGFEELFAGVGARPTDVMAIDDPIFGLLTGPGTIDRYRQLSAAWRPAARFRSRAIGLAISKRRVVGEFELTVPTETRAAVLPVAVVVEVSDGDLVAARIYQSTSTLTGQHVRRAPLIAEHGTVVLPPVVARYLEALAAGDAEGCLACYEPDGRLQGGGGPAHAIDGTERLRAAYVGHLDNGGIVLEPCSVTVDLPRVAVEFTLHSWGGVHLDQAGLSVYVLGPTGRISQNRVYDDQPNPTV